MHPAGKSPINGAYKSLEIEIVNLGITTFVESPGDHRSLCFDILTRSLLGEFRYKVCQRVSRRLVTSQPSLVTRYNEIVHDQLKLNHIVERLDAVNRMMRYCGNPSPSWLRAMIISNFISRQAERGFARSRMVLSLVCTNIYW